MLSLAEIRLMTLLKVRLKMELPIMMAIIKASCSLL
jgi:hypothetical protein